MLSGVSILCFAASYTVAFVLEVSRLVFRSGVRGAVMLGFAGAGLLAHSALLYYRAVEEAGLPLSSEQDWYLLAAWFVVAVYLYLVYYHPHIQFGLFLLPLALGLIGAGRYLADSEPFARGPASQVWGAIHGVSLVLGAVAVLVGFAAALMYLRQVRRLKRKLPPNKGLRLPSLEWLGRTNSRAMVAAMLLLGVGVASGTLLGVIGARAQGVSIPWYDPLVMATNLTFAWLVVTVAVGVWYRPTLAGRKVAYLTLVSFVLLLIALGVMLLAGTQHGGRNAAGSGKWEVGSGELVAGDGGKGAGGRDQEAGVRNQGLGVRSEGLGVRGVAPSGGLCRSHCPLSTLHSPPSTSHFPLSPHPEDL